MQSALYSYPNRPTFQITIMNMKNLFLTFGLSLLAATYGCSLVPSAPAPAAPAVVVVPNVGTSWTFQNTYRDSNNVVTKTDTSTRVVVAKNMTIQGDTGVVETVETFSSTKLSDTFYIQYLSNGNISRLSWPLLGPHIAPEWLTIPYFTHKTSFPYLWSGFVGGYKGYTADTVAFATSYANQADDTVGSTVYSASVVNTTISEHYAAPGKDSLIVTNQTNSFIASAGIFGNARPR